MLNPVSPGATAIANLFLITLLIAAVIFLLVSGLVVYIAYRFRHRPGQADPSPTFGLTRLEVAWTIVPALTLGVLFILTVDGMNKSDPAVAEGAQPNIVVIAHQWWWELHYPQLAITTANEIHLPVGQPMLAQLGSADVIHDLWIPQVGRKIDMVPGKDNFLWLQAGTMGVYPGACAEYCGQQHAKMLVSAIVQPQSDFNAWAQAQAQPARPPTTDLAIRGLQVFQSETCINCHAINGTTATARVGPDLTHVASRQTLASGVLTNTEANLTAWLKDPQAIKPGSYMPNVQLTNDELTALVAYLETLK
jgi:cytochrome c oxidase subunit 2